jgi:N6-adenosine-specific RNA methylase IME4
MDVGKRYQTIVADPPWKLEIGEARTRKGKACCGWNATDGRRVELADNYRTRLGLQYEQMTVEAISKLDVPAAKDAHCYLWTINKYVEDAYRVMRAWGFKYLAPVTWIKPSGVGAWFIHRTQTMLFGYKSPLSMRTRYKMTDLRANAGAHSAKPSESYDLIEAVSEPARVEIFARPWTPMFPRRDGWDVWGNEVPQDVALGTQNITIHNPANTP